MQTNISRFTAIAVLATASPFTAHAGPQVYDLKADWSNTENPNGTWSYLSRSYLLLSNDPTPWMDPGTILSQATVADHVPGVLEVGDIYGRGIVGFAPLIRWTVPSDGTIDVSGAIWNTFSPSAYIEWDLTLYLSRPPYYAQISSGSSQGSSRSAPADFSAWWGGPDSLLNISVRAGDRVDLFFSEFSADLGEWGDSYGINFTVTFTPDAVDPVTAVENLALAVMVMNLQNGIENSLDSKLDAAKGALDDVNANNDGAAYNSLQAFINAVEAQRGSKLTEAQAGQLVSAAQEIQDVLSSP